MWIATHAEQMQIPPDFLVAPFLVYVGSLLGRKRALKLRPGTDWYEYANLWGWSGLSNAEEVEEVLEYLMEKNYLSSTLARTGGRPTKRYWVHPNISQT